MTTTALDRIRCSFCGCRNFSWRTFGPLCLGCRKWHRVNAPAAPGLQLCDEKKQKLIANFMRSTRDPFLELARHMLDQLGARIAADLEQVPPKDKQH